MSWSVECMSAPQGLTLALAVARVAIAIAVLPYALDWRSPPLASVRAWALAGLMALPVGLVVAEMWTLRRAAVVSRSVRALSLLSLVLAALCLAFVLWPEAQFQWKRYEVLRADVGELEKLGRHII